MIRDFLEIVADQVRADTSLIKSIEKGEEFENKVLSIMQNVTINHPAYKGTTVDHNGAHSFPDVKIIFNSSEIYGVEIKFSATGNWRSKGNSVFESLSNKESGAKAYKDIYVFFGRKPKAKEKLSSIEVKYKPYGSSVDKLEVTHSPRFAINMNDQDHDLSSLFGTESTYAEFRVKTNEEKNQMLQDYFSQVIKEESSSKWYMPKMSDSNIGSAEPILLSSLSDKQKNLILAESFILFPFDLLRPCANYKHVARNLISKHFIYSASLRDNFSSKGKVKIFETEDIEYPRILKNFMDLDFLIKDILRNPPYESFEKDCYASWNSALSSHPNITISFSQEDTLEYSFEKIIINFKPSLSVKNTLTGKEYEKTIDLSRFYTLKQH